MLLLKRKDLGLLNNRWPVLLLCAVYKIFISQTSGLSTWGSRKRSWWTPHIQQQYTGTDRQVAYNECHLLPRELCQDQDALYHLWLRGSWLVPILSLLLPCWCRDYNKYPAFNLTSEYYVVQCCVSRPVIVYLFWPERAFGKKNEMKADQELHAV